MTGMTGTKIYQLTGETKSANCYKLLFFQQNEVNNESLAISFGTQRKGSTYDSETDGFRGSRESVSWG